jgi:hypothetical protein
MKNIKKGYYFIYGFKNNISYNANNGVEKKILEQVDALNIPELLECRLVCFDSKRGNSIIKFFIYLFFDQFKNFEINKESIDFVYIRRFIPNSNGLLKLIKRIKKYNPECKLLYEIPTYPYDQEHKSFKEIILLFIDRIYRAKLKKHIDRVITFTNDDYIFKVKTIRIINGIKCKNVPIVNYQVNDNKTISLIAVAQFAFWHGYERLIEGYYIYYNKNVKDCLRIKIHFIGDGQEILKYKNLVKKYKLENNIIFYGPLHGSDLDKVFNVSDIGIGSLASHRKNIYLTSELKSREYLARGLPIVMSTKVDCIPDDFKYCLYVPEDESPINIENIIEFYNKIYKENNHNDVATKIRTFAEQNIDISYTMKPIVDFILR